MSENTTAKKTFAERAAAEPTELHKQFAAWIEAQTGIKPDLKTVQLVTTLRMDFQKSDENQAALKERKVAAEKKAAEALARKRAKLEAELAKLNGSTASEDKADEAKPEEPAEAPKDASEPTAQAEGENAPETATEAAAEAKTDAPKPRARRTRRTTGTK